jgi:hypothetical protein
MKHIFGKKECGFSQDKSYVWFFYLAWKGVNVFPVGEDWPTHTLEVN